MDDECIKKLNAMVAANEIDLTVCPADPSSVHVSRLKDATSANPHLKDEFMTAEDQSLTDFDALELIQKLSDECATY